MNPLICRLCGNHIVSATGSGECYSCPDVTRCHICRECCHGLPTREDSGPIDAPETAREFQALRVREGV